MTTKQLYRKEQYKNAPDDFLTISRLVIATKFLPIILLMGALLFVFVVRIRMMDMPLERQEAGFAYVGRMMFRGVPLYSALHEYKLPGLYFAFGLITNILGPTPEGIRGGLLFINLMTILNTFWLGSKIGNSKIGAIAAATLGLVLVSPNVAGFSAHATQILMMQAVGGLLMTFKAMDSGKKGQLFFAGVLFGIAFLIKQPAIFYLLMGWFLLLIRYFQDKKTKWSAYFSAWATMTAGALLPYMVVIVVMAAGNRLSDFWFWTHQLPLEYSFQQSQRLSEISLTFLQTWGKLLAGQTILWLFGTMSIFFVGSMQVSMTVRCLLWLLPALTFGAVCVGFRFYQHYYVLMLPGLALLIGFFINWLSQLLQKWGFPKKKSWFWALTAYSFCCGQLLYHHKEYFLNPNYKKIHEQLYGEQPFLEAKDLGNYIKSIKKPTDKMVVFGSEPEFMIYADMESVTGHVFMYPLVDGSPHNARLQQEMMEDVERNRPAFLVYVRSNSSWERFDVRLINWMKAYIKTHYQVVGVAATGKTGTVYKYGKAAEGFEPTTSQAVFVFRKKN